MWLSVRLREFVSEWACLRGFSEGVFVASRFSLFPLHGLLRLEVERRTMKS